MKFLDNFQGPLSAMLYLAAGAHPPTKYAGVVLGRLVDAWLFKISPGWYLDRINRLLDYEESLEESDIQKSHSDLQIREYLIAIAEAIEKEYSTSRRSEAVATERGHWNCIGQSQSNKSFQRGELLPNVNGKRAVWEFEPDIINCCAEECIKREFGTYYLPKTIGSRPIYKKPDEFVQSTVNRFKDKTSPSQRENLGDLLQAMSNDRAHSLTKEIESNTKLDWTTDQVRWT